MGSDSDLPVMQSTLDTLDQLQIPYEVKITSAHRTPDATHHYVTDADQRGCAVFIGAAGLAAHLSGVVASLTIKPVIGVPMDGGPLKGQDALRLAPRTLPTWPRKSWPFPIQIWLYGSKLNVKPTPRPSSPRMPSCKRNWASDFGYS